MCELKIHRVAKLGELFKSMQQTVEGIDRRNSEKERGEEKKIVK